MMSEAEKELFIRARVFLKAKRMEKAGFKVEGLRGVVVEEEPENDTKEQGKTPA